MDSSLLAIITAVVGIATVAARVIEKLVDHIVDDRRTKKALRGDTQSIGQLRTVGKGGYTTDLALQSAALRELREDVEKLQSLANQIDRSIGQLGSKQDQAHEDARELKATVERLHVVLDGGIATIKAQYDLFTSQSKSGR